MVRKIIFFFIFITISLLALFLYEDGRVNDGELRVVFCDVGQGDAAYIRTPNGYDILIDGGPNNDVLLCLSENMPFWDKSLDLIILTHPDSDHYSGLISVAREYSIDSFVTSFTPEDASGYKTLRSILAEKKAEMRFVCQGDSYTFPDEVSLKIVWPRSCTIASTDKNDNSVVALLRYGEFKVLLTGDAEENIGDFYQDLVGDIDILKVPHHGSKDGVDQDFLDATKPEVAIISSGANNRFGHPTAEILDILESEKIRVLRTDRQGDVSVISDGNTYSIDTEKE